MKLKSLLKEELNLSSVKTQLLALMKKYPGYASALGDFMDSGIPEDAYRDIPGGNKATAEKFYNLAVAIVRKVDPMFNMSDNKPFAPGSVNEPRSFDTEYDAFKKIGFFGGIYETTIKKDKPKEADNNIKKKGQAVHAKDLLHTTKIDGKKADKVDMKIGSENDLPIEKDKDGMDVYAGGLRESFTPGDMWSNDFDYIGMLRYSAEMELPEDPNALLDMIKMLNDLFESYTDVNYHSEARDLGIAIDYIEDSKGIEDLEKAQDLLANHQKAAAKTLKDLTRGKGKLRLGF